MSRLEIYDLFMQSGITVLVGFIHTLQGFCLGLRSHNYALKFLIDFISVFHHFKWANYTHSSGWFRRLRWGLSSRCIICITFSATARWLMLIAWNYIHLTEATWGRQNRERRAFPKRTFASKIRWRESALAPSNQSTERWLRQVLFERFN